MDFILDNFGIMIMVVGIAHAVSSVNILYVLSKNGYKSSIMTPIANIRKLKELSNTKNEHKGLYYLALVIGYSALLTLVLFAIAIIVDFSK